MNHLSIHICQESLLARLSTDPAFLMARKESIRERLLKAVNPDGPCFDLLCDSSGPLLISTPDGTTKSGLGVINSS